MRKRFSQICRCSHCWHGRRSCAWVISPGRTSPTQHGCLRRWAGRTYSCSQRWQWQHSSAWATSMRSASPAQLRRLEWRAIGMCSCLRRWQGWQRGMWTSFDLISSTTYQSAFATAGQSDVKLFTALAQVIRSAVLRRLQHVGRCTYLFGLGADTCAGIWFHFISFDLRINLSD